MIKKFVLTISVFVISIAQLSGLEFGEILVGAGLNKKADGSVNWPGLICYTGCGLVGASATIYLATKVAKHGIKKVFANWKKCFYSPSLVDKEVGGWGFVSAVWAASAAGGVVLGKFIADVIANANNKNSDQNKKDKDSEIATMKKIKTTDSLRLFMGYQVLEHKKGIYSMYERSSQKLKNEMKKDHPDFKFNLSEDRKKDFDAKVLKARKKFLDSLGLKESDSKDKFNEVLGKFDEEVEANFPEIVAEKNYISSRRFVEIYSE